MHKENRCELRVTGYAPSRGKFEFTKRNSQPATHINCTIERTQLRHRNDP